MPSSIYNPSFFLRVNFAFFLLLIFYISSCWLLPNPIPKVKTLSKILAVFSIYASILSSTFSPESLSKACLPLFSNWIYCSLDLLYNCHSGIFLHCCSGLVLPVPRSPFFLFLVFFPCFSKVPSVVTS